MATSGSINYGATRDDIITEALQLLGVVEEGGTPNASQLSDCSRTLNYLLKFWMTQGMNLWVNQELVVFPVKGQRQYTFGASGDRMCIESELVTTQLDGSHANGATSITVDNTTGMAGSDVIGIVTDSADIHWTTISSVDSSTTLTIASGLDDTASSDDRVYTYTTAFTQRVLGVNNAWIRSVDNTDIPVSVVSREEYVNLSNKLESGKIHQVYFDPQLSNSYLNVWQVPDDSYTNERLYLYVTRVYEDVDAGSDDLDFPQEWFLPLSWNLAVFVAPKYGIMNTRFKELAVFANSLKDDAMIWSGEKSSVYLNPSKHD